MRTALHTFILSGALTLFSLGLSFIIGVLLYLFESMAIPTLLVFLVSSIFSYIFIYFWEKEKMRFIRVWYIQEGNTLKLKAGSLGDTLFKEELEYLITMHLKADLVMYLSSSTWEDLTKTSHVILDTRFRQVVTEQYLGEWDEIHEY